MDLKLLNKRAIITGASNGIGKAIKEALESEGCICTNLDLTTGYDLTSLDDLERAGLLCFDADILINNVGGGGTWDAWNYEEVMQKNYGIMANLTRDFLLKSKKYGRVITISSIFGKEKGHNPSFTASKSAQIAFMKSLAGYHPGITFNTICPGHIDVGKKFPYKPEVLGNPKDVANMVTFLCSPLASHINGATITVDGGESYSF